MRRARIRHCSVEIDSRGEKSTAREAFSSVLRREPMNGRSPSGRKKIALVCATGRRGVRGRERVLSYFVRGMPSETIIVGGATTEGRAPLLSVTVRNYKGESAFKD